jgi:hypothetical protein
MSFASVIVLIVHRLSGRHELDQRGTKIPIRRLPGMLSSLVQKAGFYFHPTLLLQVSLYLKVRPTHLKRFSLSNPFLDEAEVTSPFSLTEWFSGYYAQALFMYGPRAHDPSMRGKMIQGVCRAGEVMYMCVIRVIEKRCTLTYIYLEDLPDGGTS